MSKEGGVTSHCIKKQELISFRYIFLFRGKVSSPPTISLAVILGVYNVTRATLPEMIERKSGDIINISSSAGQKGAPITSAFLKNITLSKSYF